MCRHEIECVHLFVAVFQVAQRLVVSRAVVSLLCHGVGLALVVEEAPFHAVEHHGDAAFGACLVDVAFECRVECRAGVGVAYAARLVGFLVVVSELYEDVVSGLYEVQHFLPVSFAYE